MFVVPSENTKTSDFYLYQKSDKTQFIIYSDLEYLAEKMACCKNSP